MHVKNFPCNLCPKAFCTKGELDQHHKFVHEQDVKRIKCGQCEYESLTNANLDKHVKAIHENVTYKCDSCGKTFSF